MTEQEQELLDSIEGSTIYRIWDKSGKKWLNFYYSSKNTYMTLWDEKAMATRLAKRLNKRDNENFIVITCKAIPTATPEETLKLL